MGAKTCRAERIENTNEQLSQVSCAPAAVYTRRVPRYDVPKAAPEPLHLVQRFVNTIDREHEREWLKTPADLELWLQAAGIEGPPPRARGLRRAHELREALRALLVANGRRELPPAGALDVVNAAARAGRLVPELRLEGTVGFRVDPDRPGSALAHIVGVAFASVEDGSWYRLKACRNCRWAFYDYSRNRVASWCSMSLCGNRLKTRRYRRRRARGK